MSPITSHFLCTKSSRHVLNILLCIWINWQSINKKPGYHWDSMHNTRSIPNIHYIVKMSTLWAMIFVTDSTTLELQWMWCHWICKAAMLCEIKPLNVTQRHRQTELRWFLLTNSPDEVCNMLHQTAKCTDGFSNLTIILFAGFSSRFLTPLFFKSF